MKQLVRKIIDQYDQQGISTAEAVSMTGLSESTWRRFRAGKDVTFDTVTRAAEAVGVEILSKEQMELPQASADPRQDQLQQMQYMYEKHIATITALYERRMQEDKKKHRTLVVTIIILSIILAIYLLLFDARNGDWGFIRF